MKRLGTFCGCCFASVFLLCGTALAVDKLEQYFGEYTYQADACSGGLTLNKGGRDSYLIVVDNSCGDERVGLCGGDFLLPIYQNTKSSAILRDSESGITFNVSPKGITIDNVPVGFCGMGAYMHGNYIKNKGTTSIPQKAQAPQPPKEIIVCGTAKDEIAVNEDIATVFFIELDSQDVYKRKFKDGQVAFFYNDHAPASSGYAPCNELVNESRKRGFLFCFTLTTQTTPPVLKQAGVKEDAIFWGGNCAVPN